MMLYRITLTMTSPSATPWRADTFFGHLCWGMAYMEGEGALRDFLASMAGADPPLVLSDGCPGDFLPRPIQGPGPRTGGSLEERREAFDRAKAEKRRRWLTLGEFEAARAGEPLPSPARELPSWLREDWDVTFRNTIRRDTGTTGETGEGGLHAHESFWWPTVTFYARLGEGMPETRLSRLLAYVVETGYGKEKSRGLGRVGSFALAPFEGFVAAREVNGFVALSTFVPAQSDPTEGAWRVLVKYGKVSEGLSATEHPFKRPLVMLEAGATFRTGEPTKEWYGRMVDGIYPDDPSVKQYGLTLAAPCRVR